jgi:DNA-binding transcriptional LysR family regulator
MDLRRVMAFIAVADALSVTKAAERLHISQPPLSRQIHQLELDLGFTLFVRHRHGVSLTDAGRRLLEKARELERAVRDFQAFATRAALGDEPSTVRVGIAWGLWDLINRTRIEFAREHPTAALAVTDASCWYDSDEQLRQGSIDVALARPPYDPGFETSPPLLHEPIHAIVSETSPLAQRGTVSLKDLAAEPLLLWDRHVAPVLYDQIEALYARAGVSPQMIPTPGAGPFNHAGMMLVASGKGAYLGYGVPTTGSERPSGVIVLPVSDPGATTEVRAVYQKGGTSTILAHFLECARRVSAPADRLVLVKAGRTAR